MERWNDGTMMRARQVLYTPQLADGAFRQFGYLPLTLF